jgi:16S rRNA (guanine527-N7)-methyltransferase
MNDPSRTLAHRLNSLLAGASLDSLDAETAILFENYFTLLLRWNERTNLTAIRDEAGILSRHFVESIACARALPIGIRSLLDFGSGAGFPGIPITLCRPEITVTLAESQGKKVAFLREAVRTLRISAIVHSARAESLGSQFDCVALRAVDRMPKALQLASGLVTPQGWLALMTTRSELPQLQAVVGPSWFWSKPITLPGSEDRLLALATRAPTPCSTRSEAAS